MTKKLSKTAQVALLKRLRRACPCSVWSGIYGYTCGGLTGVVRSSSGMAARSKEAYRCLNACSTLRLQAFKQGYDLTLSTYKFRNL
jgi:hypothetical protein